MTKHKHIDLKHIDWRIFKRLDWYIVRKFLGTFFFSIILILSIGIVFDLTEKMDEITKQFLGKELSSEILACACSYGGYGQISQDLFR